MGAKPTKKTGQLNQASMISTEYFEDRKISAFQLRTILICLLMNMLDGMDIMTISYAAPSIAKGWTISPEALGVVFSVGLLGMTLGTMFLAPRADKIGRKTMILICVCIMGANLLLTSFAQSVWQLGLFRFISGLAIGGILATTATLAAEYAPRRTKDLWVSAAMSGYPLGATLAGLAAARIIPVYGWRAMYELAGTIALGTLPVVYFFLAESLDFLLKTHPVNALNRANRIIVKMKTPALTELPMMESSEKRRVSVVSLLTEDTVDPTIRLWVALFMAFSVLYFLTSWIPKLASAAGLSVGLSIYSGALFNFGAFIGIWTQGYLSSRFGLRPTIFAFLTAAAALMISLKFFIGSSALLVLFALIGFCVQGGFVGLYVVSARLYSTHIRATGVGWAIGAGRTGAIAGTLAGGVLVAAGLSMSIDFIIFALPAALSGIVALTIASPQLDA